MPIPEEEYTAIVKSVFEAVRRSSIAGTTKGRMENRFKTRPGYKRQDFEADHFIHRMAYSPRLNLNEKKLTMIICAAAKRDDKRFFIRLGKVLARKPMQAPDPFAMRLPSIQIQFLISQWIDGSGDYCDLCRLTPEGLLAVLQHKFGRENINVDVAGIVKLRQRLGLRAVRKPKVHVMLVGDRLIYND